MATNLLETTRPAWQTDDLVEEWVEEDEDEASLGIQSISLTEPLPGFLQTPSTDKETLSSPTSPNAAGTFLIREDMPAVALLPKTPGRQINKTGIKDFFSPLALEKMFEPPSPPPQRPAAMGFTAAPAIPSRLSQAFTPNDSQSESEPNQVDYDCLKPTSSTDYLAPPSSTHGARKSSLESPFTFSVPCHSPKFPQAESTPGNVYSVVNPPMTDPRLRLFQLQYDTFTRDHLSAIVDSIAVNTPSGGSVEGNGSSSSLFQRAAFYTQQTPVSDATPIRSIKRVKLSPPNDFYGEDAGAGAVVSRPTTLRIDYVGESRSLMQQIKQARDFSTISTTVTTQSPASHSTEKSHLRRSSRASSDHRNGLVPVTTERSRTTTGSSTAAPSGHSSLAIRLQAENLMQQIKNDMKGSKRLFSGDTELSRFTHAEEDPADGAAAVTNRSHHSVWSSGTQERSRRTSPKIASPRRPSSSSRHQPSPRKFSRSVSDDQERSLVHEMSNMSIEVPWQTEERSAATRAELSPNTKIPHIRVTSSTITLPLPPTQIPRSYPSSSLHSGDNDDLNRFVSSSTASGTTITASSAPSFVKHAGPVHITHITPSDVPSLPQRVGKMVYDKDLMRWMKATAVAEADDQKDQTAGTDAESEDPFRDIESLREDDSGRMSTNANEDPAVVEEDGVEEEEEHFKQDMTRIEEVEEETNDQEEVDLTSFTFDGPSVAAIHIIPSEEDDTNGGDETSEFESDDGAADAEEYPAQPVFDSEDDLSNVSPVSPRKPLPVPQLVTAVETTPIAASRRVSILATPVPSKPALKSMSTTPISAMKDPSREKYRTPAQKLGHRRSVSFSDGKRDGPIRGLSAKPHESDDDVGTSMSSLDPSQGSGHLPSARSKRIAELMQTLENTVDSGDSPTRSSTSGKHSVDELQPLGKRRPSSQMAVIDSSGNSRRVFSMSRKSNISNQGVTNATFLTECSFGLTHDRLVQVITDVQPFEPNWEDLNSIDLSRKALDSVARLKEFLPRLDSLTLNLNQVSWLSGIPGSVRTLSVASNVLTGVTSYSHLQNLENLDISNNEIDSLSQLQCLRHLRELRADRNQITSLDGLQKLDALTKLSLQGNLIREVDFDLFRWPRLEMLNLSDNQLVRVASLALNLPALIALNVDGNLLEHLDPGGSMGRMRILRASNNRLHTLNVAHYANLRTLYLDNNSLPGLVKAERLGKLENLSMRNQSCRDFHLSTRQFRDVKRLYLSGNKLKADFIGEPCYNLVYLEVAACRLTSLPRDLGRLTPNLRVLNLNYNFLEEVTALDGLTRLKKLTMIGSRLKGTKPLIRVVQCMPDVEMLDFRMNPCTLGWYLPLLVRDAPGALQPCENQDGSSEQERNGRKGTAYGWQELDSKFRRDLPDDAYVGRLAYRGLIMRACTRIRMLDGVEVSEKERTKAHHLLQGIMGKSKIKGIGKLGAGGEADNSQVKS
ncbi:hypothetical protein PAXRUDRAFT_826650 [Paxillus rubicundulus Ve08.2h10]|uniref:Septation initiation network scaffold protein cdc11 n=1 Tax=Paxillus rubicundulus Ve08.2h10 TaxID=930991 RepID=A0A0D0DRP1_9AGAM|nr:hypothetical protein PAXRUDRAFT_826650 [Paxillus rubicundulus Ve08.2h10]